MTPETVPCDNDVTVTAARAFTHLCPFVDEVDHGTITITWTPAGATFELHNLAAYLDRFANSRISHESITDHIRHDLSIADVTGVTVSTEWETAGFTVHVQSGEASCVTSLTLPVAESVKQ